MRVRPTAKQRHQVEIALGKAIENSQDPLAALMLFYRKPKRTRQTTSARHSRNSVLENTPRQKKHRG